MTQSAEMMVESRDGNREFVTFTSTFSEEAEASILAGKPFTIFTVVDGSGGPFKAFPTKLGAELFAEQGNVQIRKLRESGKGKDAKFWEVVPRRAVFLPE